MSAAIALADRLEAVRLDREPYFTILAGQARRYGYSTGETAARDYGAATMRGTASGEILDIRDGTKKRTRCVRRDERKKCVEEKVEVYRCRKLAVRFDPSVRLIAPVTAGSHSSRSSASIAGWVFGCSGGAEVRW